jgi:CheY-like chemotaxis protein
MNKKFKKQINNSLKVLLVEDNEINIIVATWLLEECGIQHIVVAHNGTEVLNLLSYEFDLVLLDIGLPDMSGIEVCRQMRKNLKGKPLPIIACTANETNREACLEAGMNDFILKPITTLVLKTVIQKFIKSRSDKL